MSISGSNTLLDSADMAASFQSDHITLPMSNGFAIHAVFTGSPTGSFYIAVTIDGINWAVLPDSTQAITAAGDIFYNVTDSKYQMARVHYSFSSGTGSCDASYSIREV